jgi:hypothetical protein
MIAPFLSLSFFFLCIAFFFVAYGVYDIIWNKEPMDTLTDKIKNLIFSVSICLFLSVTTIGLVIYQTVAFNQEVKLEIK